MKNVIQCVLLCFSAGLIFTAQAAWAEGGNRSSPPAAAPGAVRTVRATAPVTSADIARRAQPAAPRFQTARTMSGEKIHPAGAGTPKTSSVATSPPAGNVPGTKKNRATKPGLAGFAASPFTASGAGALPGATKTRHYGPGPEQKNAEAPLTLGDKQNITVSAQSEPQQTDRLTRGRAAFAGGPERIGRINDKESTEVSMSYKLNQDTAGRVTVNPNDPDSPLYRPAERSRNLNGAGLYMDMSVSEDLNVTLGGEYSNVQDSRPAGRTDGAAGAALGFTWNF
ncbi:MAG: hypothetical protein LBR82_02960 [Desulfovibrio sp.]|jgi:hypothetical protein|nr:hypothetical protein [Desulfovibrio sp.]